MSVKPTRSHYAILYQVCNLIPAYLVSNLAKKYGVDKKARTYSPWSHVVSLLYAQLAHSLSLNDVCDALKCHASKLGLVRKATPPKKNTFSYANRNRDCRMAEALFWETLQHLTQKYQGFGKQKSPKMPRRFKRMVNVVDSTTIKLVANCMDWARHRRKKAGVKVHLGLNLQSFLPKFVIIDTAQHNDSYCARALCGGIDKGEIVVFDKAYVDFKHLFELFCRGVFWVTRAKKNMTFRVVKKLLRRPKGNIVRDDLIVLTNPTTKKHYPKIFRYVVAIVEVDGKKVEMEFISNNLEWEASSIVDLYQSRWNIEVFFKELKQTLQLSDFLGHNKNAILWQIWTALLLYVLIRFLAFSNKWSNGFKRLFCLLRSTLWDRLDISSLLKIYGTASGKMRMKVNLTQTWIPGLEPT